MGQRKSSLEGLERQMNDFTFYRGKRVFVTGFTGFKGSWLCRILVKLGAVVTGYSLPAPTEPNLFSMADLETRMTCVTGDIRDREELLRVFSEFRPEIVFHLAAQPIVREGYRDPAGTYETNVMGTVNLLECIRVFGESVKSAVIVTTDKVYENKEWCWGFRETERLCGRDPYSNSKSCAELVVQSYISSFFADSGVAVSTARAGNVIGGGDFAEYRIIPDCVRAAQNHTPVMIRNPYSIRPYQHVLEPLFAYLMIARAQCERPALAGAYNVGPDERDCVATGHLADLFCGAWGDGMTWEKRGEAEAFHEANFLRLDCAKLKSVFQWTPRWHIEEAVSRTVEWTKAWLAGESVPAVMDEQINRFIEEGADGQMGQ